ncbi:hypothetical protein CAPTEDRAFT_187284 [Capitella teleta]|uniref:VWFD domain-containing protein n=1 Tax=Capitella teleta TaxID=283909 RepID=X1ZK39_CAPTE|nr:hypothetical protein CAPTEDRAFT_187284 [Capitella teleta]|eukprot:ELU10119.1 hypothetical protein CAPTEDRAFT_187284 [Capitella teleta]
MPPLLAALLVAFSATVCQALEHIPDNMCIIKGDPHILQYDADKSGLHDGIYVTSTCSYTLTRTNCDAQDSKPVFWVTGSFKRTIPTEKPTAIYEINAFIMIKEKRWGVRFRRGLKDIRVYKLTDKLLPSLRLGSGQQMLGRPAYIHKGNLVKVQKAEDVSLGEWKNGTIVASVSFTNGMKVFYDGQKRAMIEASGKRFVGKMCGLCGNNDMNLHDENRIGPVHKGSHLCAGLCDNLNDKLDYNYGEVARSTDDFVKSWYKSGARSVGTCRAEWNL